MAIMQYNSKTTNYEAILADGSLLIVDSDVYAEQEQEGVDARELEQSSTWENCLDGERVRRESKTPIPICSECGCPLDDDGTCPVCKESE